MLDLRALLRARRAGPRARGATTLPLAALAALVALALAAPAAGAAVSGAAFTTINPAVDGEGHCLNGPGTVNCNIYDGKDFVWLNGGPTTAYVGDGSYFFAVLEPGGQPNPNDGGAKNLSDDFGAYTERTFSVTNGTVSYPQPTATHDFADNKIRLMPYADTTNPGGVYILAICSLANGYPVKPSSCKYDAFKVAAGAGGGIASPLTVLKDAEGSSERTFAWDIDKSADKTLVKQIGGSATFKYTVKVSHDAGTVGAVTVRGTITIFNPNIDANGAAAPVQHVDVTDALSDGTVCDVAGGNDATISDSFATFAYTCDLSGLPAGRLDNTATATWPQQTLANGDALPADSANFTFEDIQFTENQIDECVDVTDSFTGALGRACVGGDNPTSFAYSRTVSVPQFDCVSYGNTATFTTNDSGATDSAGATVTVCGPARTGALTMGFWQNKNGQGIITSGAATAGVCNSGTWLRQFNPFKDLSSAAKCADVATYVVNVIKAANASGTSMNPMLKAQMLATALDVYFSDPALGGNRIGASGPIGSVGIDLTKVCKMLDSSSGAACSGTLTDVSGSFGGAPTLTVREMLAYAASQANTAGSLWYGNVKSVQEGAKNAFDAVNNQVAFRA
jgi:hypothetical protein